MIVDTPTAVAVEEETAREEYCQFDTRMIGPPRKDGWTRLFLGRLEVPDGCVLWCSGGPPSTRAHRDSSHPVTMASILHITLKTKARQKVPPCCHRYK